MARKRNIRKPGASRNTPKNRGDGGFFRILVSTPVRQLLMTAVIVVLLAVYWDDIKNGLNTLVDLSGVGLAFIVAAIVTLIVLIWKRALSTLLFRWYRWLGSIAFVLAIWGILAFSPESDSFSSGLGGKFGRGIIAHDASVLLSVLRIIGLVVIGVILMAPRESWRVITGFFTWLYEQLNRQPAPLRPLKDSRQPRNTDMRTPGTKPPLPDEMTQPLIAPEVSASQANLEALAEKAAALKPTRPMLHSPFRTDRAT